MGKNISQDNDKYEIYLTVNGKIISKLSIDKNSDLFNKLFSNKK